MTENEAPEWLQRAALTNPIAHAYLTTMRAVTRSGGAGALDLHFYQGLVRALLEQNDQLTKAAVDAESRAMPRLSGGYCESDRHAPSEPDTITGRIRCLRCNALIG